MAKRTCDPTIGSIGRQTYLLGRNGQVVRARVIPANPNTAQQVIARGNLRTASKAYDALTQVQISAWIVAAAMKQTRSRLGMSGAMTGNQLFVKVNAALLECGSSMVTTPPTAPAFATNNTTGLTSIVSSGTLDLKIQFDGALPSGMRWLAAPPQNAGVRRIPEMVDMGVVPTLTDSEADVSTAYAAKFGNPALGQVVFVATRQMITGYYGAEVPVSDVTTAS